MEGTVVPFKIQSPHEMRRVYRFLSPLGPGRAVTVPTKRAVTTIKNFMLTID